MGLLSSYVSSRIHIYALMFLLGAVSLDLVFDSPILFSTDINDEDYLKLYQYYSNTMPSMLATMIMPIVVIIGSFGILTQVYLDKSILSYVCLIMTILGGTGYMQMMTAEMELKKLNLNQRSELCFLFY